jgi:hypothetical protein
MANIRLGVGKTLETSSVSISTDLCGDIALTAKEALELSLELPIVVSNLNGMFWRSVPHTKSSHVQAIEYLGSKSILRVTFPSGAYLYYGVPKTVVDELSAAPSAGAFVQSVLVKHPEDYPCLRI